MPRYYNKDKIKSQLEVENIYDLLDYMGGEPEYTSFGLTARTICHNPIGAGSRKLYYYTNSHLFHCFSGCQEPSFDIFELSIKIAKIQKNQEWELYDAMCFIADYFGFAEDEVPSAQDLGLRDWAIFEKYKSIRDVRPPQVTIPQLKTINPIILTKFEYPRILSWENEGISYDICKHNLIGYYPGNEQITIPHFNINGDLIGIRGRFLSEEDSKRFGKYRPLIFNKQQYNHPLSMNLYNLNNSKDNIKLVGAAVIFEGEKSVLKYQNMYGLKNDISVASCGSSLSIYQVNLLKQCGAREIIIAFDRQFVENGDEEFIRWTKKLTALDRKFHNEIKVSFMFDKEKLLEYKSSPIDHGQEIFEQLMKKRIYL